MSKEFSPDLSSCDIDDIRFREAVDPPPWPKDVDPFDVGGPDINWNALDTTQRTRAAVAEVGGRVVAMAIAQYQNDFPEVAMRLDDKLPYDEKVRIGQRLARYAYAPAAIADESLGRSSEVLAQNQDEIDFAMQLGFEPDFVCIRYLKQLKHTSKNIGLPLSFKYGRRMRFDDKSLPGVVVQDLEMFGGSHDHEHMTEVLEQTGLYKQQADNWARTYDRLTKPYTRKIGKHRATDILIAKTPDGEVVATGQADHQGRVSRIYKLAVTERYRGQGVARRIMQVLEARAKANGNKYAVVYIDPDRDDLRVAYDRMGYHETGEFTGLKRDEQYFYARRELRNEKTKLAVTDQAIRAAMTTTVRASQSPPPEYYQDPHVSPAMRSYEFPGANALTDILSELAHDNHLPWLEQINVRDTCSASVWLTEYDGELQQEIDWPQILNERRQRWVNLSANKRVPLLHLVSYLPWRGIVQNNDSYRRLVDAKLQLEGQYISYDETSDKLLAFEVRDGQASRLDSSTEDALYHKLVAYAWYCDLTPSEAMTYSGVRFDMGKYLRRKESERSKINRLVRKLVHRW